MELPSTASLPIAVLVASWGLWSLVLLMAVHSLWRAWNPRLRHLYPAATLAVFLLWKLAAIPTGGPGFHFFGLTVYTLMFGWGPAALGASVVVLGQAVEDGEAYRLLAANALLLGVLPVSLSDLVRRLSYRHLPHHLFIYLFVAAFFGAIFSIGVTVLALTGALVLAGVYPLDWLASQYLPYLALFLLPEGVLNGMITTVLVGLRPQWLVSFDDHTYLR